MIKNQWYAVLSARQLKQGQMVAAKRCGIDLVFFRDKQGKAHALMDLCAHRGAALSAGEMKGDCIMCPFHGIEYDGAGKAQLIPANGKDDVTDLKRFNVKSYPIQEKYEILFLWYGDGEPQGEIRFFDEVINEKDVMTEVQDPWKTHYSRTIENQLDVAHLPFVHHNTIGRGNKTLVNGPKVIWENEDKFTHSADNEVDHGQKPKKSEDARIKDTYMRFLFPNMWLNHISEKFRVMAFFIPVDDENMIFNIRLYNHVSGIRFIDKLVGLLGNRANLIVAHQDRRVVETERPARTQLKMGETLLRADKPIVEYRKHRQALIDQAEEK